MDNKIDWCLSHGVKLIAPNDNLSEAYFSNAEETLFVANLSKSSGSNMWLATHKYYTEYLAAYAILMKIGIKSEIHSCTIAIIKLLEQKKIIDFNFSDILDADKDLRIDNQYYLKDIPVKFDSVELAGLLLRVRKLLDILSADQIIAVRDIISGKIYK